MDMLSLSLDSTVFIILLLTVIFFVYKRRSNSQRFPPAYKGWIPWIGCAFEFGVAPVDFINKKKRELGPVFTLCVAGERLTFLTEPEDFHHFFQSSNVDFQKAVQNPVQNVASVSEESFNLYHTKIHDMVKGRLASSRLMDVTPQIQKQFQERLKMLGQHGEGNLMDLVRDAMYAAVMNTLFGDNVLPTNTQEYEHLCKQFIVFDEQFEYGARLPPLFLKDWSSAKGYLLTKFRGIVSEVETQRQDTEETLFQNLIKMVDRAHAPNYGVLLLWASLANAVPITFWTLCFILLNKDIFQKVRQEIDKVLSQTTTEEVEFNDDLFRKMPYLKLCVLEAIRLHPVGIITRRVTTSFTTKDYLIPKGDMLMVSPYWSHRNPKYFPDPDTYNPDRWREADLEKNIFLEGFIAFGGGRYMCPGRWFALMEIQMFVALFIHQFDSKVTTDKVPLESMKHLVGTQQPAETFNVGYNRR